MPNKVLHILGTAQLETTGIGRMVCALARGLDPERYSMHAWFLAGTGPLVAMLESAGLRVRVFNWTRGARDVRDGWRFLRALGGEPFAIVHQHFGGQVRHWLVRRATQASLVIHLHASVAESRGLRPLPISVGPADAVIVVSHAVAKWVVGAQPLVVHPGVHIPAEGGHQQIPGSSTGRVLGTAGRLVSIKGIVYLVRALSLLRAEFPDIRLEIAGIGPEQPVIEREVRLLGLANYVRFLGWQTDLMHVLAKWDVFVQPSLDEGFGIAALEAMAAGLPVVATDVGGLVEVVEEGHTGWLVPPKNPTALSERVRLLLLNPELRLAMGTAGKARAAAHFSMDRMVAAISKIYEGILKCSRTE